MQTHSDESLEGGSDYNENDGMYYLDYSGRYITRQVSENSYFAPELFKDEFDEKVSSMFSERRHSESRCTEWSRSRSIEFASLDEMKLEPLPMDSVGILDSPCNRKKSDLDDFAQLLGRLI